MPPTDAEDHNSTSEVPCSPTTIAWTSRGRTPQPIGQINAKRRLSIRVPVEMPPVVAGQPARQVGQRVRRIGERVVVAGAHLHRRRQRRGVAHVSGDPGGPLGRAVDHDDSRHIPPRSINDRTVAAPTAPTPSRHFSARHPSTANRSLSAAWRAKRTSLSASDSANWAENSPSAMQPSPAASNPITIYRRS